MRALSMLLVLGVLGGFPACSGSSGGPGDGGAAGGGTTGGGGGSGGLAGGRRTMGEAPTGGPGSGAGGGSAGAGGMAGTAGSTGQGGAGGVRTDDGSAGVGGGGGTGGSAGRGGAGGSGGFAGSGAGGAGGTLPRDAATDVRSADAPRLIDSPVVAADVSPPSPDAVSPPADTTTPAPDTAPLPPDAMPLCGAHSTCGGIEGEYDGAFKQAVSCQPSTTGNPCQQKAIASLGCGCEAWVTSKNELDRIKARWEDAGCKSCLRLCPLIACQDLSSGQCGNNNTCVNRGLVIAP